MSFTPTRQKTLGAAILGTLALGACDDPVAGTDLRPEGDPEVLAVLVFNDTENGAVESATYCKPGDAKRPGKVGIPAYGIAPVICPLDVAQPAPELTDAWPDQWYVRIMFDELLDPEIETLEPILDASGNDTGNSTGSLATTKPVSLKCQDVSGNLVDVDYDGYYSPSGNAVTWPLGPSLVIKPLDPTIVPVESECQVSINPNVKDKEGNAVPSDQRGPYKFKIAPVSVISVTPSDGGVINPAAIDATGLLVRGVKLGFNVQIDDTASYCATPGMAQCFSLTNQGGENPANPFVELIDSQGDGRATGVHVGAELLGDQTYTLNLPTDFKIKDKCGKESTVAGVPDSFNFDTNPTRLVSINPGGGDAVAPAKKIVLSFNQLIDASTFTENTDFTLTPTLANLQIASISGGTQLRINGDYKLNTSYTLTIKSGASISDAYGKQAITFAADRVVTFKTEPAIKLTASTPANNANIVKPAADPVRIQLTFNQQILSTTLDPTEYTLVRTSDNTEVSGAVVSQPSASTLRIQYSALPKGSYKFTLKAGAMLTDKVAAPDTGMYTQAADRVISFTVTDAGADPTFKCLGQ